MTAHDPVTAPAHYTVHSVQPIEITRHLSFCLGNVVKYVLRAPYKAGVVDLRKALQYLQWEADCRSPMLTVPAYMVVHATCERLADSLLRADEGPDRPPDELDDEQWGLQAEFLEALDGYLATGGLATYLDAMRQAITAMLTYMEPGGS